MKPINTVQDIEIIKKMIVEGGNNDEINARIWCVRDGVEYIGTANDYHMVRGTLNGKEHAFRCGSGDIDFPYIKEYTCSIKEQKDLEVAGWVFTATYNVHTGLRGTITKEGKYDIVQFTSKIQDGRRARLYCWLCVMQWELENETN